MSIRASKVLVDRLQHALERQGVALKRRALLETAAYAFAYRDSNAFTEASRRGDLSPPKVEVIGRMRLAEGRSVLILKDVLAGIPYGIDEDHPREEIGISPYGHLLNLTDVETSVIAELSTAPSGSIIAEAEECRRFIQEAIRELDGYTAEDEQADDLGQAENGLARAIEALAQGSTRKLHIELSGVLESLSVARKDDPHRHVQCARDAVRKAQLSTPEAVAPATPATCRSASLAPFLLSALEEIDLEIESRKVGGDPDAWKDMQVVSDLGHAALRAVHDEATGVDETHVMISKDHLRALVGAAQSYSEDVETGISEGLYDEEDNQDIDDVDQAIAVASMLLRSGAEGGTATDGRSAGDEPSFEDVDVHIAIMNHAHGSDVRVAASRTALDAQVADFCIENWSEVSDRPDVPDEPTGLDPSDVVSTYYGALERMESEDYLETMTMTMAIDRSAHHVHGERRDECGRCGSRIDVEGRCGDETCPFSDTTQNDARGWTGHPEAGRRTADDRAPASVRQTPEAPIGSFGTADEIASELENGAAADIWYDAHEHGGESEDDPDRIAEDSIGRTQNAMLEAARILRHLKPRSLADGSIMVDGRIQSKEMIARRTERDSNNEPRYIAYHDGEPGDATISMVAEAGLPFANGRGDGLPLDDREHPWFAIDEVVNPDLSIPFKSGASLLWRNRKWLGYLAEFSFPDQGDDSRDDASALRRAERHEACMNDRVAAFGGVVTLDENATEFSHELTVMIPLDFAMESESPDDWKRAVSYLLATDEERASMPRVVAEYTAQKEIGRSVYSVEPAGDTTWDATLDALRWGPGHAVAILVGPTSHPDDYAHSPMAPEWVREWSSKHPFEVSPIGLDDMYRI